MTGPRRAACSIRTAPRIARAMLAVMALGLSPAGAAPAGDPQPQDSPAPKKPAPAEPAPSKQDPTRLKPATPAPLKRPVAPVPIKPVDRLSPAQRAALEDALRPPTPALFKCRRGPGLTITLIPPGDIAPAGETPPQWTSARAWKLTLGFQPSAQGFDAAPLAPGTCAFADRGVALKGAQDELIAAYPLYRRPPHLPERRDLIEPSVGVVTLNRQTAMGAIVGAGDPMIYDLALALADPRTDEVTLTVLQESNVDASAYERCRASRPAYATCPTLFEIVTHED